MHRALNRIREPIGFQHRTRQSELVLLRERQGAQQVAGADRNVALGKALQKDLRARGMLIEERCRGGEQQDVAIARLRAHRLLGLRQKPGMAIRIGKGSPEDLVPPDSHILLLAARQSLPADRRKEKPSAPRNHEACKTVPLRLQAKPTNRRVSRSSLPGNDGHSSTPWRRSGAWLWRARPGFPRSTRPTRIRHGRPGRCRKIAESPCDIAKTTPLRRSAKSQAVAVLPT